MVNCRDNSDKTAVHLAAAAGHPAVLTVLAEIEGCQLDAEDADGRTIDSTVELNTKPYCIDVLERRLGIQKKSAERTLDGRSPKKKNKRRFFTEFFRLKRDGEPSHEQRTPHFPLEGNTSVDDCRRNSEVNIDLISNHRQISLSRKRDHELLESITRLQISRSDNPALGDRPIPTDVRSPPPTDQDQGHFIWNTPSANQDQDYIAQSRTPTNHDQDYFAQSPTLTNQDQSYVVRSPTPAAMFRQDRSLSPGSSPMSLRIEANRAQLEEDAAQILALQLDKGQPQLSPTQGGKSPRPLDPIVSPREKSGANRSPTPPGWNNTHQNCLPTGIRSGDTVDDNEGFPSYSHHKKKKKKPRLLQTRGQQLLTQQTALSLEDPEDRESDNKADDKLEMLTPRLGAGSKVRDAKEQITFNRNVQTLLH
ncbi:hypothetical protein LSH36_426g00003 [Paralvinella palmiformis]|uniref:Ankyrin repeat protein n=1 Tax=Paralvinella palmiformis TaxID=53620 RepID=A0AAD9N0T2_9ANNE|nr:hypothetical protein LSH36_426g00003 [Paralvinella palmiformis]